MGVSYHQSILACTQSFIRFSQHLLCAGMMLNARNTVVNNIYHCATYRPVRETVNRQMDKRMKANTSSVKCWEKNQQGVDIKKPGNIDFRLGRLFWGVGLQNKEGGASPGKSREQHGQKSLHWTKLSLSKSVKRTGGKREAERGRRKLAQTLWHWEFLCR